MTDKIPKIYLDACPLIDMAQQPHTKHPAAVVLGRMARGVPKRITESDRKRRQEWARGLAARRKKSRRTVAPAKKNRLADSRSTRN